MFYWNFRSSVPHVPTRIPCQLFSSCLKQPVIPGCHLQTALPASSSVLLPSVCSASLQWFHVPCHPYTPVFRQQILLDFWVFSFSSAQDNSITTTWFIFLNKISMIQDFFSKLSHRSWLLPTSSTNSESGFQSPSKLHEHIFGTS